MEEKQETEEQVDYLLPYLHEIEVERAESPFHIRFGR